MRVWWSERGCADKSRKTEGGSAGEARKGGRRNMKTRREEVGGCDK